MRPLPHLHQPVSNTGRELSRAPTSGRNRDPATYQLSYHRTQNKDTGLVDGYGCRRLTLQWFFDQATIRCRLIAPVGGCIEAARAGGNQGAAVKHKIGFGDTTSIALGVVTLADAYDVGPAILNNCASNDVDC